MHPDTCIRTAKPAAKRARPINLAYLLEELKLTKD
jgi:hypothetical protein